MKTVIRTTTLISKVSKAQEAHQRELLKARKNWRKETLATIKNLATRTESFDPEAGRFTKGKRMFEDGALFIDPPPKNMGPQYSKVLRMLQLDTREEIELDEKEYNQFIENDWNWRRDWALSNSKYL